MQKKALKMPEKLTVRMQNLNIQTKEPKASGYKTGELEKLWDVILLHQNSNSKMFHLQM